MARREHHLVASLDKRCAECAALTTRTHHPDFERRSAGRLCESRQRGCRKCEQRRAARGHTEKIPAVMIGELIRCHDLPQAKRLSLSLAPKAVVASTRPLGTPLQRKIAVDRQRPAATRRRTTL